MANNNQSRPASNRPPSSQPGNGGNWPATTGNKSGGNRGNASPKGGKK